MARRVINVKGRDTASFALWNEVNLVEFGQEITEEINKKTKEMADKATTEISRNAEQFTKYGSGEYAKTWYNTKAGDGYIVASENYRLPHLLEYPHPIIAYGKQVAYWSGKAHIGPVAVAIAKEFDNEVNKIIDKDIKKL